MDMKVEISNIELSPEKVNHTYNTLIIINSQ